MNQNNRLDTRFAQLKNENRTGFVSFITAGDPDAATSLDLLKALPSAGVDVIELGMPFSDPMADGVAIQAANLRALKNGACMAKTLGMVAAFRTSDNTTPIVLMGYYNPIYAYGVEKFIAEAAANGVDGVIIVDLPPEEDEEFRIPAQKAGMHIIRLATPTTNAKRLPVVLNNSGGFIYYVAITGITGAGSANNADVGKAVAAIKQQTKLPVAVGFGIKDAKSAEAMAQQADAVVVGSAIVQKIADLQAAGTAPAKLVTDVIAFIKQLSEATHKARTQKAA